MLCLQPPDYSNIFNAEYKPKRVKNYYNYILVKRLKSPNNLPLFKNIKDLILLKSITSNSINQFKKFYDIEYDKYDAIMLTTYKNPLKKAYTYLLNMRGFYPNLLNIEIFELNINDVVYGRYAVLEKYFNDNANIIYKYFSKLESTFKTHIYKNNNRQNNFKIYNMLNDIDIKNTNLDYKYDDYINFDINLISSQIDNIKSYPKKYIDDIYIHEDGQKEIIIHGNTKIITHGMGDFCHKIISHIFSDKSNPAEKHVFTDAKNNTEIIIDNNNLSLLTINGNKIDLNNYVVYKIAKTYYNEKNVPCILTAEIPRDARIASDGSGKYRCDKMIPRRVFINSNNVLEEIKTEECYSVVHTSDFIYKINELCEEPNFEDDLNKVCVAGIHYCMTARDAVNKYGKGFIDCDLNILD